MLKSSVLCVTLFFLNVDCLKFLNFFPNTKFNNVKWNFIGLSICISTICVADVTPTYAINLKKEIDSYQKVLSEPIEKDGNSLLPQNINRDLEAYKPLGKVIPDNLLDESRERVLSIKPYLDEIERDVFRKNWFRIPNYLYVLGEQDDAFGALIDGLYPASDELDSSARSALIFEAKTMFLSLDELREAVRDQLPQSAQNAYIQLLLGYDRFLKAGNLYPVYDPITSTEVFFKGKFSRESLRFDSKLKPTLLDQVLLIAGPDMGKTAKVLSITGKNAVVKLDFNGLPYQEVKVIKMDWLAKTSPS